MSRLVCSDNHRLPLLDMKTNNYEVVEAGETIKFQGLIQRSKSQAFFLVFCTAIGMVSLALVLDIQFKDLGKCRMGFMSVLLNIHNVVVRLHADK